MSKSVQGDHSAAHARAEFEISAVLIEVAIAGEVEVVTLQKISRSNSAIAAVFSMNSHTEIT
jgi:hypothetical protein